MTSELDPRAAGGKRLNDKVCIVTGAGQGIGRSTAKRLGAEGGVVVVADRVDEGATQTMAELKAHGVEALKVLADLSTMAGAQALIDKAVQAFGRIDVLVNNVGGTIFIKPGMTVEEPEDEAAYRREMGEDIRSQQALKRRGLPEEQAAAIAFLASDDASFITGQVINCSGGQS